MAAHTGYRVFCVTVRNEHRDRVQQAIRSLGWSFVGTAREPHYRLSMEFITTVHQTPLTMASALKAEMGSFRGEMDVQYWDATVI